MRIQVYVQDQELPAVFQDFAEKKVAEALGHLAERLTSVEVHVKDLNAHKNGIDKRCVIEARPRGLDPVAVECDAEHARDAVTLASAKLERALRHRFEKLAER
jgi:ribosome-associated translation inhibitor RaiA